MRVVSVKEFDKKRSEVTTEEGLRFVLYRAEIIRFGIAEGDELSQETLDEIMGEVLSKRAKLRAMNLLKARDYTEARLREKLKDGGYPDELIGETVDYLKSYGYIDDMRYACDFIRYRMESKSRRKLEAELYSRGVDKETIALAFEECYGDELFSDEDPEIKQIKRLMEKSGLYPDSATAEERLKFTARAARRGYSAEKIRRAMDSAGGE